MTDIKQREKKIQNLRKQTSFRDFVKEIASRCPFVFHNHAWVISRYPKTDRIKNVVSNSTFRENRDNLINNWLDYDSNKTFGQNFSTLLHTIDLSWTITQMENENSDYADSVVWSRNCYLSVVVIEECENVLYSFLVLEKCSNILNSISVVGWSSNIFTSVGVANSFNVFYSKFIQNSSNLWFCRNMLWCQECIMCDWLENKSYCIQNKEYPKEEYLAEKKRILAAKSKYYYWYEHVKNEAINYNAKNSTWNDINFSENVQDGYFANRMYNARNVLFVGWGNNSCKNFYDCFDTWVNSEDFYWNEGCWSNSHWVYLSSQIEQSTQIYHSYYLNNCSFCFGCIWLTNKQFCIFNKQYEKDQWFEKVNQIFAQMETEGSLWRFFSGSTTPFYFNDTAAYLIDDSFTKEEIEKDGYLRREEEIQVDVPSWANVTTIAELDQYESLDSEGNRQINPEILTKVIKDEQGNIYKIVKREYDFLMKYGLPLPRNHWLDRIKLWFWAINRAK